MTYIHGKVITTSLGCTLSAPVEAEADSIKEHSKSLTGSSFCRPRQIAALLLNYFCQIVKESAIHTSICPQQKKNTKTRRALVCLSWTKSMRRTQTDKDKSEALQI